MPEIEIHAHHGEHENNPLVLPVSLTISILAVVVAAATLMGHRAHTEELVFQGKATDGIRLEAIVPKPALKDDLNDKINF